MEELRVAKRRVPIEVVLVGGAVRQVAVFLSEYCADHAGAERVSDLLNQGGQFIPAVDPDTRETLFFGREAIAVIRVPLQSEPQEMGQHANQHPVEVLLMGGQKLTGTASYLLPADRSRLVDYLNEPSRFFCIQEKDRLVMINKRQVAQVVVLDP